MAATNGSYVAAQAGHRRCNMLFGRGGAPSSTGGSPRGASSTGRNYSLRVHALPQAPGSAYVADYTCRALTVHDIVVLDQLVAEVRRRLRSRGAQLLIRDGTTWRRLRSLSALPEHPTVTSVAFAEETAFSKGVSYGGQIPVPAVAQLSLGEKRETLRRHYARVDPGRTDREIEKTLDVYTSEAQWSGLLVKIEGKYCVPVVLWRYSDSGSAGGGTLHTGTGRRAAVTPAITTSPASGYGSSSYGLAPRMDHAFICAPSERLRVVMTCTFMPSSIKATYKPTTTAMNFSSLAPTELEMLELEGPLEVVKKLEAQIKGDLEVARVADDRRETDERTVADAQRAADRVAIAATCTPAWAPPARHSGSTFTSTWCEETLSAPADRGDLIEVVTGEYNSNLPRGVLVTRAADVGGMLTVRVSGPRDLVDNVKGLLESVLTAEEDQQHVDVVSEAVPPEDTLPPPGQPEPSEERRVELSEERTASQVALHAVADFAATLDSRYTILNKREKVRFPLICH